MNGLNNSIVFGKTTIANAKIKFTQSGIGEDGSMSVQIGFELPEGKTALTGKFAFDCAKTKDILNVLELRNWEELPKKYARVEIVGGKVVAVGNILNERWVRL